MLIFWVLEPVQCWIHNEDLTDGDCRLAWRNIARARAAISVALIGLA